MLPKLKHFTNLLVLFVFLFSVTPVQSNSQSILPVYAQAPDPTPAPTIQNIPILDASQSFHLFLPSVRNGQELPIIIPDTTEVLPSTTTQHLVNVSSDGSTYTFDQTTPDLTDLHSGSVMVSGVAPNAPEGFLRKVTGVTETGGNVIIQTQPATLEEAITQGSFSFSQTLSPVTGSKWFRAPRGYPG